jgi:hypothetical protein
MTTVRSTLIFGVALISAAMLSAPASEARNANAQATAANPCGTPVQRDAPATWAHFGAPPRGTPHIAAGGRMYGFLFVPRLRSGNPSNPRNKILWIVNDGSANRVLTVAAHRTGTTDTAHLTFRSVDPAGRIYPSYVNLPAAGCWSLSITWNGRTTQAVIRVANG